MLPEQLERWKDFTKRYFQFGLENITVRRRARLWREAKAFIECVDATTAGWDFCEPWDSGVPPCDDFVEWFYAKYGASITHAYHDAYGYEGEETDENPRYFYNQLRLGIRAGCDAVFEENGIMGHTVGDVRRMYDGALPDWFVQAYNKPEELVAAPDGVGLWL